MSGRAFTTMGVFDDADDEMQRLRAENERLGDMRETLRNPTDEQVDVLAQVAVQARAAAYAPTNQTVVESPVHLMVRAVLAALAGDDQ